MPEIAQKTVKSCPSRVVLTLFRVDAGTWDFSRLYFLRMTQEMNREKRTQAFVREIWSWYARHKRTLPWRDLKMKDDSQRAYMILVSEIMLQQTQVSRVQIVFKRFLESFPTLQDLAKASNTEVILAWRGMGYNSRVLRLRDAAKKICEEHAGVFPKEMDQLLAIKGIGHYTAGAIRNFAFHLPTACIDTNIRRILHRTFVGPENPDGTWKKDDKYLLQIADAAMRIAVDGKPGHTSADWFAALMDFGSLVQTKRNPRFDVCPLTHNKIMMTNSRSFLEVSKKIDQKKYTKKREPGREVGGKHIPNRIFRGRIVESLRDAKAGLTTEQIGANISVDWDPAEHREWLQGLLKKLTVDRLIDAKGKKYVLAA